MHGERLHGAKGKRASVADAYPRAVALRVGGVRADGRLVEARVEAALAVAHAFVQQRTPACTFKQHSHHSRIPRIFLLFYLSVVCRKVCSEQ